MFGSSSKHDKVFYQHFDEHVRCSAEAAKLLVRCLEGHAAPDAAHADITALLEKATNVDREVQAEARKTWITPFDGWDIRELSIRLNVLMRHIDAGAERLSAYGLCNGSAAPREAVELGTFLAKACEELQAAIHELSNKRADDRILSHVEEVQKIERECDRLYRHALAALFEGRSPAPVRGEAAVFGVQREHETSTTAPTNGNGQAKPDGMHAVFSVIKWHELYDKLEQASNACRDVANELQSIVAEHA
jgi:uncharacterized protein Yka (UPF0111/DUF47 family)